MIARYSLSLVSALALLAPAAPLHAQTADVDGPRAAMQTVMSAIAQHDADALSAVSDVPGPESRAYVESVARMLVAGRILADAASKRFGAAGDAIANGPIIAADAADIPQASVTIDGDHAELQMPGHTLPIRFHRVAGAWKLKIIDFAGSAPRDLAKQTALTDLFAAALAEAATEIEQDRYATAGNAEAAIRQKLNNVLVKSLAPATQPATAPSS